MMDQELKAEWTDALRGDEFEQGEGRLGRLTHHGTFEYCCLGVMCEIKKDKLIAAGISFEWTEYGTLRVDGNENYPTNRVCEILGLPASFWRLDNHWNNFTLLDGEMPNLDIFNDSDMTFEQIADVIDFAL